MSHTSFPDMLQLSANVKAEECDTIVNFVFFALLNICMYITETLLLTRKCMTLLLKLILIAFLSCYVKYNVLLKNIIANVINDVYFQYCLIFKVNV